MNKIPTTKSAFENDLIIKMENSTIGKSVINGAKAINIPLRLSPFKVSEITIASKGPGAIPAARPNVHP